MAASRGLECEILDREAMETLGMGALLGVAQGSMNPPFLIVLKYRPEKAHGIGAPRACRERGDVRHRRRVH